MIAGHLGIAAAIASGRGKALDLRWVMVFGAAAFLPDAIDIGLAALRICNPSALYSHTIPVVVVMAAAAGGATFLASGRRVDALLVMLLVLLHPAADLVTGRKLVWPGAELYGWRLYQRPVFDFALETGVFAVGCLLLAMKRAAPARRLSMLLVTGTLVGQAAFDLIADRGSTLKPNACESAPDGTESASKVR